MDIGTLGDAINSLYLSTEESLKELLSFARPQAIRQFNALLQDAKTHYPNRSDIQSLQGYDVSTGSTFTVIAGEFNEQKKF